MVFTGIAHLISIILALILNHVFIFLRPYTANAGRLSTVWYDRKRIVPNVPEHRESVDLMCQQVGEFIKEETAGGMPKSRIVLGWYPVCMWLKSIA